MINSAKLKSPTTVLVEKVKRFGRYDYEPCNDMAKKFLEGLGHKSFSEHDLRWIQNMGYDVFLKGTETEEFK